MKISQLLCDSDSVCVLMLFIIGEWITPTAIGNRPSPISHFTLTSITNNTAVIFGGSTVIGESDKVYTIKFTKAKVVS